MICRTCISVGLHGQPPPSCWSQQQYVDDRREAQRTEEIKECGCSLVALVLLKLNPVIKQSSTVAQKISEKKNPSPPQRSQSFATKPFLLPQRAWWRSVSMPVDPPLHPGLPGTPCPKTKFWTPCGLLTTIPPLFFISCFYSFPFPLSPCSPPSQYDTAIRLTHARPLLMDV
jgi:hypothetical protein